MYESCDDIVYTSDIRFEVSALM